MTGEAQVTSTCSVCSAAIEACSFCDEPDCPRGLCYECVSVALGQLVPQPHGHGG